MNQLLKGLWLVVLCAYSVGSTASADPGGAWRQTLLDQGIAVQEPPAAMPTGPASPSPLQASGQTIQIPVSSLFNRHFQTALTINMGGATVYVSGQFNRDKLTAYIVLYSPRFSAPLYYNVLSLLDSDISVGIGGKNYTISLEFKLSGKMASILHIKADDGSSSLTCTLGQLFKAVYDVGYPLTIGGTDFRLFYIPEIRGGPKGTVDNKRTFVFLTPISSDEYDTTGVKEEEIPADQQKDYSVHGKTVGVRLKDGTLELRLP